MHSSGNIPVFIDGLKIAVSDGAITSAASRRSLPGILSCPADLDALIVESNLYTLVNETFSCIVNCVSGLVTYDSGVLELCGMFLTKRDATSFRSNACMPTNFIPLTIFVLFYRIVAIFKYSWYSETVKLGGVTNLVEPDYIGLGVELLSKQVLN